MTFSSIVVIFAMIYFIREQFDFSVVTKVEYFFLPLLSLIQCFNHFSPSRFNLLILLAIVLLSLMVSFYQAKHSFIHQEKQARYYFLDQNDDEQKIYEKIVKVKGGKHYIIGWIIIFAFQIFLQFFITKSKLSADTIQHELLSSLAEDILSVYRLTSLENKGTTWYVWALYGASSLFYAYFLGKKSPEVHEKLFASNTTLLPKKMLHKKESHTEKKSEKK